MMLRNPRVPVSNAVQVGNRVYVSGVLGIDAKSDVPKDPRQQVKELITQMRAVLGKAGLELRKWLTRTSMSIPDTVEAARADY